MSWEKWKIQRKKRIMDSEVIDIYLTIEIDEIDLQSISTPTQCLNSFSHIALYQKNLFHLECFPCNVCLLVLTLLVLWSKLLITVPLWKHSNVNRRLLLWLSFPRSVPFSRANSSSQCNWLVVFVGEAAQQLKEGIILVPTSQGCCEDGLRWHMQRCLAQCLAFTKCSINVLILTKKHTLHLF